MGAAVRLDAEQRKQWRDSYYMSAKRLRIALLRLARAVLHALGLA